MAELPRMVTPLKGSPTLRTASHAFSLGVIGFTCGPSRKRAYQLMMGSFLMMGRLLTKVAEVEQSTSSVSLEWLPAAGAGNPAAAAAASAARDPMAAPAFFTRQGSVSGLVAGAGLCGRGASGSVEVGPWEAAAHKEGTPR